MINMTSQSPFWAMKKNDECYTPMDQVKYLFPYLDKSKTYYEATSGISKQLVHSLRLGGFNVVDSAGKNFFDCGSNDVYDGIITNPPYSIKDDFIKHCFDLGKPFALLMPLATAQGKKRGQLFIKHGMSMLIYNNRISFDAKGTPPFGNAWFMWGMTPPNQVFWVNN